MGRVPRIARTRRRGRALAEGAARPGRRRRRSMRPRRSRISRSRSSIDRDPPRSAGAGVEPRSDLVADRVRDTRVLLDQDPVADERHRRSERELARPARPRAHPSRSCPRPVGARRRRGSRSRSCRAGSRPRSRPGRCRSTSVDRRRIDARTPCSRRVRAASRARGTTPSASAGSRPSAPAGRRRTARSRRARCRSERRRSALRRSAASRRCSRCAV